MLVVGIRFPELVLMARVRRVREIPGHRIEPGDGGHFLQTLATVAADNPWSLNIELGEVPSRIDVRWVQLDCQLECDLDLSSERQTPPLFRGGAVSSAKP